MIKKDLIKIFLDERYIEPPRKKYPTNKILYNHLDKSGVLISLIWLTIKFQITKDLDIYL